MYTQLASIEIIDEILLSRRGEIYHMYIWYISQRAVNIKNGRNSEFFFGKTSKNVKNEVKIQKVLLFGFLEFLEFLENNFSKIISREILENNYFEFLEKFSRRTQSSMKEVITVLCPGKF
jgi:hypothetical protein